MYIDSRNDHVYCLFHPSFYSTYYKLIKGKEVDNRCKVKVLEERYTKYNVCFNHLNVCCPVQKTCTRKTEFGVGIS